MGAEGLSCSTCHVTSTRPNSVPHAAPHTGMNWKLAPLEFQWVDKTSAEICAQMRDPARNGGRDAAGLIEHITHDAEVIGFITWGFNPGAGRAPAPAGCRLTCSTWRHGRLPECPARRTDGGAFEAGAAVAISYAGKNDQVDVPPLLTQALQKHQIWNEVSTRENLRGCAHISKTIGC